METHIVPGEDRVHGGDLLLAAVVYRSAVVVPTL